MTYHFWLGAQADNDPDILELNENDRLYQERLMALVIDTSEDEE